MHGNATLTSAAVWELFIVLALGTTVIAALAAAVARLAGSAASQRTIWKTACLAVALLVAVELTGLGSGLSWMCFQAGVEPAKAGETVSRDVAETPPVRSAAMETRSVHASSGEFAEPATGAVDEASWGAAALYPSHPASFSSHPSLRPSRPSAALRLEPEHTGSAAATFDGKWPGGVDGRDFPLGRFGTSSGVMTSEPAESGKRSTVSHVPIRAARDVANDVARVDDDQRLAARPSPDLFASDSETASDAAAAGATSPTGYHRWPAVAWIAVAAVLLLRAVWLRLFLGIFHRWRTRPCRRKVGPEFDALARRLGIRWPVQLVQSRSLRVPVAFGWWRPTVGVPSGFFEQFDQPQQRAMLAHELAHLAAADPVWLAGSELLCAVLWWHPAVWWCRRKLQSACEAAADEASLLVPDGPGTLAGCLVTLGHRLSRRRRLGWVSIEGPGFRSALGRRVQRLLQMDTRRRRPQGPGRAARVCFVLPIVLVMAAVFSTAWARPGETFEEGEATMNVWQSSVSRSVAAGVLWALLGSATDSAVADDTAAATVTAAADQGEMLLAQRDGDREKDDREHPETRRDREEGEREHPEARRDREEGEREHPEARRDRDEGEREHPEARRDREEGEREHPEARRDRDEEGEREGDEARRDREKHEREIAEHREGADREMAEFEERLHRMEREREELIETARAVQRELRDLSDGKPEAAAELREELERVEREVHEIDAHLERGRREFGEARTRRRVEDLKRQIHELSEAGRHEEAERLKHEGRRIWAEFEEHRRRMAQDERGHAERGEVERRLHHLRVAVDNLRAAGMHDAAERLAEQAERLMLEHRGHRPDPHRPEHEPHPQHHDRPHDHDHPGGEIEELRHEVHQLREEMHEIRARLRRLVERD